ncbi:MAG: hypothetical protein JXB88_03100 [Spirochaetales bacterium]|nr:hypothetical protein [Spirochaetales bacterium]
MAMQHKGNPDQQELFKKEIPQMPKGYYSGDQPNPNLKKFVEEHLKENPYDPENDDYDIPPFDKPIETTKATAIYNMHTYWSKKPHDAIRQYILHYTKAGDLVLDPFCGSGGTALAALMEGRKAIAIDRSPAATFITKNYCTPVDTDELQKAFEELKRKVKPEIDWLYETRCDRCGGKATTAYTVYSQVFQCTRCLEKIPLFDCIEEQGKTKAGKPKKITVCPYCYKKGIVEEISTRSEKFGAIPVMICYICKNGCKPAKDQRRHNDDDKKKQEFFKKYDFTKLKDIDEKKIPYWYPTDRMMHAPDAQECWGVKWRAGTSNFRTVDELFTKRNLWALGIIKNKLQMFENKFIIDAITFCWTSILLNLSRMTTNRDRLGFLKGTYYIPQIYRCTNSWRTFENKFKLLNSGWNQLLKITLPKIYVSTENACKMNIKSNSIDYIFTDPPYAGTEQYGELNFVWEAWLGYDTHWHHEEIIVNEIRGKTEIDWANMMEQALSECLRVLKPGRCISLCYHDTSEGTWSLIQDIMAKAGFIIEKTDSALFIDTGQKSYNQKTADKVIKRDLVINFRKPKPGEITSTLTITGDENQVTFREKIITIIRDYLTESPGSPIDRIYDEVVSRMVRAGQMEAHNFEEILKIVAEEIKEHNANRSRWYLKESELTVIDKAETVKEDNAFRDISKFMKKWLSENPGHEGVHYSDLFEFYIYTVMDKPRRSLSDWLLDYFYKTETGTYRLPVTKEEEELKAQIRAKGTNRKVKKYLSMLEQGVAVSEKDRPNDATLAEWIRNCKRSGLFEEGKLLYEKGGLNPSNLPEDLQIGVEEDYQVCVRMVIRSGTNGKK